MKLCIISDSHNKHKHLGKLPEADVIIHCGDMTSIGKEHEIREFLKWYSKLDQYKYKIFIAGNHDWLFDTSGVFARSLVPKNVIYLQDNGVEIEGIKFYGTPVQLVFNNWAFNKPEERLIDYWEAIPDDTDVLITHQPPYSIMDWSVYDKKATGSPSLYKEVLERIKPKVHCFGHIHSGHGVKVIEDTTFINASNLDEDYMCVYNPVLVELIDGHVTVINQ